MAVARTHLSVDRVGGHLIAAGGNRYDFTEKGYSQRTIQSIAEKLADQGFGWAVKSTTADVLTRLKAQT